jgi:oligosaccharide repeat unit polymerase
MDMNKFFPQEIARTVASSRWLRSASAKLFAVDLFAPWILIPLLYILYFSFGFIPLTSLRQPTLTSFFICLLGLACYLFGIYIINSRSSEKAYADSTDNLGIFERLIMAVVRMSIIGIVILIIIYAIKYGIPILDPALRTAMPPKFFALITYLPLAISLMFAYILCKNSATFTKIVLIFASGFCLTLFSAFRTPVVVFIFAFIFVFNYCYKKLTLKLVALLSGLLGLVIVGVQQYRLQTVLSSSSFSSINPHGYPNLLIAAHMSCHEGSIVFSDLVRMVPFHGLFHGEFFQMVFATLLSGSQIAPHRFVSLLRETRLESGTTPSILGGPYLDFGIFGVIVFMFAAGAILAFLYRCVQHPHKSAFCRAVNAASYAYFSAVVIISIHIGLLDPVTIILLSSIFFVQVIANGWYRNRLILIGYGLVNLIIVISLMLSYVFPDVSPEEHMAIKFGQDNINDGNLIGLDKYLSRTAISQTDKKFKVVYGLDRSPISAIKNSSDFKYFVRYILSNDISKNSPAAKKPNTDIVYSTDNIIMYRNG